MNKETIKAKKDAVNKTFDALEQKRVELQKSLNEITMELVKLQGEYRMIESLEKEFEVVPPAEDLSEAVNEKKL